MTTKKLVPLLLYLYCAHSVLVGIGLIIFPADWLQLLGFKNYSGHFFMSQAGVFHLIMAGIYFRAARTVEQSPELTFITIAVKATAFIFLIIYYILKPDLWILLLSGIADGTMAFALLICIKQNSFRYKGD